MCFQKCKEDYSFYGLESGNECWCGDDSKLLPKFKLNRDKCDTPCGGNLDEDCGGDKKMLVYSTKASKRWLY